METKLAKEFYEVGPISEKEAEEIAVDVEKKIFDLSLRFISGPLIRELVNSILLDKSKEKPEYAVYRNILTRVGAPVHDAYLMDIGQGFKANENANLQPNPETSHKRKADWVSGEEYLLLMPSNLADAHLAGDLHIHDLEYFGTRPFCMDASVIVPIVKDNFLRIRPIGTTLDALFEECPQSITRKDDYEILEVSELNLFALSRGSLKKIKKVMRRPAVSPALEIITTKHRRIVLTKEHFIQTNDRTIPVNDVTKGTKLIVGPIPWTEGNTTELSMVDAFLANVPREKLCSIFIHGVRSIIDHVKYEKRLSVRGLFDQLGLNYSKTKHWYYRGIMPIDLFGELLDQHDVPRYLLQNVKLGAMGSPNEIAVIYSLTPALMRSLGYFVAEGNYNCEEGRSYNLVITNENPQVYGDIKACIEAAFNTYVIENKRRSQICFGGKLIYLLFRYVLGIPEGAENKRIPELVFNVPKYLAKEFWSAYITGNGTNAYRPEKSDCIISVSSTSHGVVTNTALYLQMLGINSNLRLHNQAGQKFEIDGSTWTSENERWFIDVYDYKNVHRFAENMCFLDAQRQGRINAFLMNHRSVKDFDHTDEVEEVREVTPTGRYYYDIEVEAGSEEERFFYAGNEGLILIHNCQDWDLRYFFYYGLMPDGIGTRTSVAGPAKHPEVAVLHTAKILASAQTNFAGGEGFYNFLVFLAPYMRGLDYSGLKQLMQMMFFEYTQAYVARGGQLVFSNIQVQPGIPELWRDVPVVARGRVGPDVYGDYEDEVRLMFRALYDVAHQGDHWGKPFNFPKLENGISPEFLKPEYDEYWLDVHRVVAKFGTPYFDNMMPAYRGYGKGVSCFQCCAYCFIETPESSPEFEDKLYFVNGKHFTMGSWQVVSLNLPRIAYIANGNDGKLFEEGRRLMDSAIEIFKNKKKWMNLILECNRIPFATQRPLDPKTGERGAQAVDFDELVFTIGVVGGNEMAQWHTGYQLHEHPEAIKILVKLILEMQRHKKELEERSGLKLALARTPAESTAQRFAIADVLTDDYRDKAEKVVKGDLNRARSMLAEGEKDAPIYYSNGTHVYVGAEVSLIERVNIEQKFFPLLNGGNMLHVWLGDTSPDAEALHKLTKRISTQTHVGYYAYTKDLTICNSCGRVTSPIYDQCPYCDSPQVEWWSRVTGYYQAVSGWNEGKKKELQDRYRINI